jgi:hypothetical protein
MEEELGGKDEFWQWAIIETTIPNMTLTSAEMAAFMNPKPKPPLVGIAEDDVFNYDDYDAEQRPPLRYPGLDGPALQLQVLSGQTDQVSSLLVDLRAYPGGVKFDLYGFIHSYIDPDNHGPATASFLRAGRKALSVTANSGTWHTSSGLSGVYANSADIAARTIDSVRRVALQSIIEDQFPETVGLPFATTSQGALNSDYQQQGPLDAIGGVGITWGPAYAGRSFTWSPGSGNMPLESSLDIAASVGAAGGAFTDTATYWDVGGTIIKKHRGLGYVTTYANFSTGFWGINQGTAGPVDANGNWGYEVYDYTSYYLATFSPITVYPTRAGPVRFAVFDGKEPDGFTRLQSVSDGFGQARRWESKERGVGNRWPMKQIAVANIRSIDAPVSPTTGTHFGMPKLGTVIINPRKGKGGIKFIAA